MLEEIQWYTRRLARMPAEEVAFRLYEEGKRRLDARRAFGWRDFAWAGAVRPLPGLAVPGPEWRDLLQDEAAAILGGRFNWLGVTWPRPARDPWWDGNIWLLDPSRAGPGRAGTRRPRSRPTGASRGTAT
jgi:hypothetical protein